MNFCLNCKNPINPLTKGKRCRKQRKDVKYCGKTCWSQHMRSTDIGWACKVVYAAKARALKKKIPFDLDSEYIVELLHKQGNKCAVTKLPLDFSPLSNKINPYRGSLDRVDSSKGYTKDNIRIVCIQVNYMKHEVSDTEMKFWCEKILKEMK